jgi:hypothetical protein
MLEIGDKIQRYEFDKPIGSIYVIDKVTKTLAKSEDVTFLRAVSLNNIVERKDDFWSFNKKYVLIK